MTDRNETEARIPDTGDAATDEMLREAWQPALRMALDSHGAPARCKRRACRMAGACRMSMSEGEGEGEPLDCGGGLTDGALRTASVAALFGALWARHCLDGTAGEG